MPVSHSKQSIYSLCGSVQHVCSAVDLSASDNALRFKGLHGDVIIKQQVGRIGYSQKQQQVLPATN